MREVSNAYKITQSQTNTFIRNLLEFEFELYCYDQLSTHIESIEQKKTPTQKKEKSGKGQLLQNLEIHRRKDESRKSIGTSNQSE